MSQSTSREEQMRAIYQAFLAAIVVRFITHGKESTIRLELDFGHLLAWQDGKIRRLEWFRTGKEAMQALAARA